jgi:uncharacterized protein
MTKKITASLPLQKVETPCVGICSTIYGDNICRGCFRSMQEVVDWNAYTPEQKLIILERLNKQITEITASKLTIVDAKLLKAQCQQHRIKIREEFTPYTWAHALLREGLHEIKDISKYGVAIHEEFAHLSLAKLIELIDDELFTTIE